MTSFTFNQSLTCLTNLVLHASSVPSITFCSKLVLKNLMRTETKSEILIRETYIPRVGSDNGLETMFPSSPDNNKKVERGKKNSGERQFRVRISGEGR